MATASTRRSCVTSGWTEHAIVAVSVLLRMALMSCAGDVLAGLRLLSDNPIMQADRAAFFQRLSAFMMGGRMPLFFLSACFASLSIVQSLEQMQMPDMPWESFRQKATLWPSHCPRVPACSLLALVCSCWASRCFKLPFSSRLLLPGTSSEQ